MKMLRSCRGPQLGTSRLSRSLRSSARTRARTHSLGTRALLRSSTPFLVYDARLLDRLAQSSRGSNHAKGSPRPLDWGRTHTPLSPSPGGGPSALRAKLRDSLIFAVPRRRGGAAAARSLDLSALWRPPSTGAHAAETGARRRPRRPAGGRRHRRHRTANSSRPSIRAAWRTCCAAATTTSTPPGAALQHDYVVQQAGAFDETVVGLQNLGRFGVPVEIRVVVHRQTFAVSNFADLWIDPWDYHKELTAAITFLAARGMKVWIYNLPLCLVPHELWRFCQRSISDWKNEYLPVCGTCAVRRFCGGFFSSALPKALSQHILPFTTEPVSLEAMQARDAGYSSPGG
jgi:hypothetical protein